MASNKNADQLKVFYAELSKIAKSEDWNNILKVAKKSINKLLDDSLFSIFDKTFLLL